MQWIKVVDCGQKNLPAGTILLKQACPFCSYTHLDIYSGLNSNLNRQHHRLESRYSSSSGGSYEEEKSKHKFFAHLSFMLDKTLSS